MKLQSVCDRIVQENEGSLSCSILDLDTGLALARRCGPGVDEMVAERDSQVALDVCRGRMMRQFAQSLAHSPSVEGFVQEAQVTTSQSYLFVSGVPGWPNVLFLLVTERSVSMGLGWMAVRQASQRVAESRTNDAEAGYDAAAHEDAGRENAGRQSAANEDEDDGRESAVMAVRQAQAAREARDARQALDAGDQDVQAEREADEPALEAEPTPAETVPFEAIRPDVPTLRRRGAPPTITPRREPEPAPVPAEEPEPAPAPAERQPAVAARLGPRGAFFRSRNSRN